MSQTWTNDVFAGGHVGQTDLQNMEDNFLSLKSLFSGLTAPSNLVAGMPWFDTTNAVLKMRDTANSYWLGLMHGQIAQKMWVYRNDVMDGWVLDGIAGDCVLGVKGGTTYTTGAVIAGAWDNFIHSHDITISGTLTHSVSTTKFSPDPTFGSNAVTAVSNHTISIDTSTNPAIPEAGWRPSAAVGTIQYLDVTV
jgi:hypothetical protein